ncbi:MAG: hypothetical protein QOI38_2051 [Sphingomonadales bacterium]|jgi:hypothetical protein|nr:hypothetical protein [Sphingomonadales bacterium]
MARLYALADRHGRISFSPRLVEGLLPVGRDSERRLRAEIEVTARHAYDGKTLLVPGVPEAPDADAALDALIAYRDWIAPRLRPVRREARSS